MSNIITVIKPNKGFSLSDIREIYTYRDIFLSFVERDIKVRYKQTVVGGAWAIIRPLFSMILFTFFFGKIAKIPSDSIPYPIFSYSGLLLWSYFSTAVSQVSSSLVSNKALVSKVYFPRIIIPLAASLAGLVDYAIASIILIGMMIYFQILPPVSIVFLPIIMFFTWMLATGVGFWLAATNVLYRDVQYLTSFLMQLWIYATPVIYPLSVAGNYTWIVSLNPVSGLIEAHRSLWLGHQPVRFDILLFSLLMTLIIFVTGALYFKRVERIFADII